MVPKRPNTAPTKGRDTPGPGSYRPGITDKNKQPIYGIGTS